MWRTGPFAAATLVANREAAARRSPRGRAPAGRLSSCRSSGDAEVPETLRGSGASARHRGSGLDGANATKRRWQQCRSAAVCAGQRLVADGGSRRQTLVSCLDISLLRLHDYRPAAVVRLGGYKCLLKVPHLLTRGLRLQRRPARPLCGQRLATLYNLTLPPALKRSGERRGQGKGLPLTGSSQGLVVSHQKAPVS